MKNSNLRIVPVDHASEAKPSYQRVNRSKKKMLLGTYVQKFIDANGIAQWKIVNIPDEMY